MNEPTVLHPVSDADVAQLPLGAARHDLLEEILQAGPARSTAPSRRTGSGPRRAVAAVAVAAAVAAVGVIAVGPPWLRQDPGTSVATAPAPVERVLLDAAGWRLEDIGSGGATYRGDGPTLEISWRPASLHDGVLADRKAVGPATTATVLGSPSVVVAYSDTDHAAVRPAEGSTFVEVRGQGLDLAAFDELLGSLVPAPAVLPAAVGDGAAERDRQVGRWQRGLEGPSGVDYIDPHLPGLTTAQSAAVTVLRGYACGWIGDLAGVGGAVVRRDAALAGLEQLAASPAARAAAGTPAPAEVDELLDGVRDGTSPRELQLRCVLIQGG